jgi:hypothetical protein
MTLVYVYRLRVPCYVVSHVVLFLYHRTHPFPLLVDEIDLPNYFQGAILASDLILSWWMSFSRLCLGLYIAVVAAFPSTSRLRASGQCTLVRSPAARLQTSTQSGQRIAE